MSHLRRLGYHVTVELLRPNEDWAELEDRQRWLLLGTLAKPFTLQIPGRSCSTPASAMLDPPDPAQDRADAERIVRTIVGLRAHNARHRAAGHGFGFTEIAGHETRLAVIPKSYHKINTGPFVQTPFGLRLLRQARLSGFTATHCSSGTTQRRFRFWGKGCRRGCFVRCFASWLTIWLATRRSAY